MWLLVTAASAGQVFLAANDVRGWTGSVIDARGEAAWKAGHVPNSAPVDWKDLRDGFLRDGELSDDLTEVSASLAAAGVSNDRPVLVVGAAGAGWGEEGRLFWTLEYLGHAEVYVLDGGVEAWSAAGLPLHDSATLPAAGDFRGAPRQELRRTTDQLAAALETTVIWDTRTEAEFAGATPYGESRGGHIPGAVSLSFRELIDAEGLLLPRDQLRALLVDHGLGPDSDITTLCTGGVRSGFAYAVLRDLGYTSVSNYDGSMWAWAARSELPLEVGP